MELRELNMKTVSENGKYQVSTVSLGYAYEGLGLGVFETMVFPYADGSVTDYEEIGAARHNTLEEAERGHADMVRRVNAGELG